MKFPVRLATVAVLAALALAGCSTIDSILSPNPNVVATMEASLAAADNIALQYVSLPSCATASHPKICRDPAITKNIGTAAQAAYTAVKAAEANETAGTVASAQNAITAYQAITNALQ